MIGKFMDEASMAAAGTPVKYFSGSLQTRKAFKYGKFRTSMSIENHQATCATFFTYADGSW